MLERIGGRDHELHGSAVGLKPAGTLHQDVWGRSGTLIFTLNIHPGSPAVELPRLAADWSGARCAPAVQRLVAACLAADRAQLSLEAAVDLLALVDWTDGGSQRPAPPWLERARCQIHDAPHIVAIDEIAREAGVNRAHLSRMFGRCYGVPPSVYRQQVAAARAVASIARSKEGLADAALNAGYSDQAHMNRAVKSSTGFTPGHLRQLLSA